MSDCRNGGRDVYEKPWTPTVVSFFREMDTSELRAVYVNGIRFNRADDKGCAFEMEVTKCQK